MLCSWRQWKHLTPMHRPWSRGSGTPAPHDQVQYRSLSNFHASWVVGKNFLCSRFWWTGFSENRHIVSADPIRSQTGRTFIFTQNTSQEEEPEKLRQSPLPFAYLRGIYVKMRGRVDKFLRSKGFFINWSHFTTSSRVLMSHEKHKKPWRFNTGLISSS